MDHRENAAIPAAKSGPTRGIKTYLLNLGEAIATLALVALTLLSPAEPAAATGQPPYVVRDDRGGFLRERLIELRELRASGRQVEIRGRVCYSTCTLLLSLPNTCISPRTQFGFHGPSESGHPLSPEKFDYYSHIIAQHYPAKLNQWYMQTGRKRIKRLFKIKGSEIIRMGVPAC
ncbi:hypothetical protein [Pseudophaeobacter flagellatus]|uniref:hypothetical protein n=1 Tax=Pseudophaeobacter flagellatus TaxID=2899119 RepID=UPI001E389F64|nr:hypothetical protein [Pseudophaeobacter flagellatus]MCD9149613.1 hypothetical protein [Pseudophaeobacter flagellatus]